MHDGIGHMVPPCPPGRHPLRRQPPGQAPPPRHFPLPGRLLLGRHHPGQPPPPDTGKLQFNCRNTFLTCLYFNFTARNEVGARIYFHRHLWFCSQGGSASVHAGILPPPGPGRYPPTPHPWDQAGTLPPHPTPPPAEHTGRYGQRAGSMYPTGMQSCFLLSFLYFKSIRLDQTKWTHSCSYTILYAAIPY